MSIRNLLFRKRLIKSEFSKEERKKKLFEIVSPHLTDWKEYAEIVDIVKKNAPTLYKFGEGVCRYISLELINDLSALCIESNLMENYHFRKKPADCCSLAYKLYVPSCVGSGIIET